MIGTGLANEIRAIPGGENLEMCYILGNLTSKCMIQHKLEPEYNPRRLLRMVMMEMREESFANPTTWLCSSCDLCYPACPQQITYLRRYHGCQKGSRTKRAKNAPAYRRRGPANLRACGLCAEVCPYEAITI
jgi:heterodisulfide reductase subunit C